MWRLPYLWLRLLLALGFHGLVYKVADRWLWKLGWTEVAWRISPALVKKFGYQDCSACFWVYPSLNDHLVKGSYCWEQHLPVCDHCGLRIFEGEDHSQCEEKSRREYEEAWKRYDQMREKALEESRRQEDEAWRRYEQER